LRSLSQKGDLAQDFDDGDQHDACEFLIRLLSNALDAEMVPNEVAGALRWTVPRGNFSFEELKVLRPVDAAPAGARAVVAYGGSHYVGHVALPDGRGWRAVSDGEPSYTSAHPQGMARLAFFSTNIAPMFMTS